MLARAMLQMVWMDHLLQRHFKLIGQNMLRLIVAGGVGEEVSPVTFLAILPLPSCNNWLCSNDILIVASILGQRTVVAAMEK